MLSLRKDVRCAIDPKRFPRSNARVRTYVPLLQSTRKETFRASCGSSRETSKLFMMHFLSFRSTVSPRLAALYRRSPLTLMALYMGGICVISPTIAAASFKSASSVTCSHGARSSTSVAASWLGVPSPSRNTPVYTLSMPVKLSTIFVALPTHKIKRPVASGSSVPQWPTFFTPNFRVIDRVFPTTSNEVQPLGLSMSSTRFCHVSALGGGCGGDRKKGGGGGFFFFFGVDEASPSDAVASADAAAAARLMTETRRACREKAARPKGATRARQRAPRSANIALVKRRAARYERPCGLALRARRRHVVAKRENLTPPIRGHFVERRGFRTSASPFFGARARLRP